MNEYNLTLDKVTIKAVTSSTPLTKITYSTFSQTPAIQPITINIATIPSATIKTEVSKSTLNFNSTIFLSNISNLTTKSSITEGPILTLNTSSNILSSTTKVNNKPYSTNKPLVTSRTSTEKLITTSNNTNTKSLKVYTTIMPQTFNTNSSIIKPEIINTTMSTLKLINISLTEVTTPITKLMSPLTTIIKSSIKPNTSENVEQLNIMSTTRSPKIMKMTPSTVITESKTIVNKIFSTVPINKFNVIDIYNPAANLNHFKYNTVLTNNKSSLSNNNFSTTTNEYTNQSLLNFNTESGKLSTVETPYGKPELNYSLHNQHMLNVNVFLTKHLEQNGEYIQIKINIFFLLLYLFKYLFKFNF